MAGALKKCLPFLLIGMIEKILVITERDRPFGNIFLVHKTNDINYKKELLKHIGRENNFSLCIIENKMSVQEYLELVKFIKHYFSMPVCAFEYNIVQSYPGEILVLKEFIDIIIKRKLEIDDFYLLFETMIYNNDDCEKKVESLTYNGKIVIFPGKRIIAINDKNITLTKKEFDIFYYLFQKKEMWFFIRSYMKEFGKVNICMMIPILWPISIA